MRTRLVLFTVFVACGSLCTASSEDLPQLSVGRQETRELKTGDAHVYGLSARKGEFVLGEVFQAGVDVAVTVSDPDGDVVGRFDGPARGPEHFPFETRKAGLYRISVLPFEKEQGEYTVRVLRQEPLAETPAGKVGQLMAPYRADGPGGVVAVVRSGEIEFAAGYGLANVEYGVPNTRSTPYHMASVSKQFTAFAVVLLSLEGKLGLDDDVRKYLPEMPDFGHTVTLRHLLNHTSGVRDHWTLWAMSGGRMDDVIRQQDLMRLVTRQRDLNFEPGAEYLYSNAGYLLLSEVVTRVSGRPFGEWMKANVFEPLGMSSTQIYDDHERLVPGRAYSYQYSKNGLSKAVLSYANSGATSLFTTAEDLARWLRNFRTGQVGGKRAIELLQVQGVLNGGKTIDYALGVGIGEQDGLRLISHGGADAGFRTWLGYYPEIDAGVVVLGNVASLDAGRIGARVAEAFFAGAMHAKEPARAEPEAGRTARESVPADLGKAFAGVFEIEGGPSVTIAYEDGRLSSRVEGQAAHALLPAGDRTFRVDVPEPGVRIVFESADQAGAVDKAVLHQNGEKPMRRVARWEPDAEALAGYTGRYYSSELDTFYTVSLEGKKLVLAHRRHGDFSLTPEAKDVFASGEWFLGSVKFGRDQDGHVGSLFLSNGRVRMLRFERVEGVGRGGEARP
jgi:CubicO group peptidase (beta-lactamase class C family)